MNPLDHIINFFDPIRGRHRAQARVATRALMNYDAATGGARTSSWRWPATDADAALYTSARKLRQVSRDMIRNRPLAARAQRVTTGSVVGAGILPSLNAPDMDGKFAQQVTQVINDHLLTPRIDALRTHTLPEMQEIAMNAVFSDGEVLLRRRWRTVQFEPDLVLPFQVQMLEVDHLNPLVLKWGENVVLDGVEYGPTGRIVAYHLLKQHPGKIRFTNILESERVPAADIIHLRRAGRPEQLRGEPWLAPVLLTLADLSDYQEAQIVKQKMSALLVGIVETEDGSEKPDTGNLSDLAPGTIVTAPQGSKVKFSDPPQVNDYGPFMTAGVRSVAIGIGLTYEALSGDLGGVNYSSGRMGHIVMDRNVDMWQQNIIIGQMCCGIEGWIRDAWPSIEGRAFPRLGIRSLPAAQFALDWTAPRRPLIDPVKEIPALAAEVESGLTSMQRQQRRLGYDPETIRRERVQDMEANAAVRLPPPGSTVTAALASAQSGDTAK